MLSAVNAAFVARESAIPGLATLLDPEALTLRLRETWPGTGAVRLAHIRHKPGTNTVVLCEADDGARLFVARAFADAGGKLAKAKQQADAAFDDIATVVYAFPHDPDLPALARIADAEVRRALLARALKGIPELADGTLTRLAYKPMRRYVARLDLGGAPRAVVKLHAEAEFPAKLAIARLEPDVESVKLPQPLGFSRRYGVIVHEWAPGAPLGSTDEPETARRVGAALAALHRGGGDKLPTRTAADEADALSEQAAAIAAVLPDLGSAAADAARRTTEWLQAQEVSLRLVHGDFSATQVAITDTRVALIDLDEAHRGDPGFDLGHFVARLDLDTQSGRWSAEAAARAAVGFLDGYAGAGGVSPAALPAYAAWGMLRMALEPFRRLEPDWPAGVAAAVARAGSLAEGSAEPLGR